MAAAVDGHPDADENGKPRVTITRDSAAGNYVSLDLGNGRLAFYEHLQEGSVRVKVGDRVSRGQSIALLGSLGSVSSGPLPHFHVSNANSPLAAAGVAFVLRSFLSRSAFASIAAFAKAMRQWRMRIMSWVSGRSNGQRPTRSLISPLRDDLGRYSPHYVRQLFLTAGEQAALRITRRAPSAHLPAPGGRGAQTTAL